MTNAERERMDKLADLGCILTYYKTGVTGTPAAIHHMLTNRTPSRRSGHDRTIPLAPRYHQTSNEAIHVMGRKRWEAHHGVTEEELLALANEMIGVAA